MLLLLGSVLAGLCVVAGTLLTPPAIARWTIQTNEQEEWRAVLALIGVRHLPLFLLAVALGNAQFRLVGNSSVAAVGVSGLPYLVYVFVTGILESLAAGETAFSWLVYEPSYFIWPHFVAVPAGLMAAAHMVRVRKPH
jgi:hypothetical protein